ncbi:hypothetical protein [Ferruginibacter albus]|uniref:hypothetical protein n=1 Tax=Ferruginibacter albus TaxID=2875540 RepID=UPI001CC3D0C9|nr:hypothetical protein [Ferruginibacter albus]UAY51932.1 hypothetical protein K9M53_15240 [Ferruginibacter albus]
MLPIKTFAAALAVLLIVSSGCKKDETNANLPVLTLSPVETIGKSNNTVNVTVTINSPGGFKDLVIYKTINLQKDPSFATQTISLDTVTGTRFVYHFSYTFQDAEIDQLVGVNFHFDAANGTSAEKDLTLHTTTSGATILYSRKWKLVSRLWETSSPPNAEDEKDCEKDNVFSWNKDSSYNVNFGANTGANGCDFDGFNVPDKWWLTEDEKTFHQVYHSLFDPSNITTETYTVKELTSQSFQIEQVVDLTVFGLSDHEKFLSMYVPAP